jgi:CysZ protein
MCKQVLSGFGLLEGVSYPYLALTFLFRYPSLLCYVAIPLLLNLILGIFLYWQLLQWGSNSVELAHIYLNTLGAKTAAETVGHWHFLEPILRGFWWLVEVLLNLFLLIVTGFILSQLGVLLGSPWYEKLSEKLEILQLGQLQIETLGWPQEMRRAIAFELKKIVLLLGIGGPSLLLNFVPGLGPLAATIIGLTLTATLTCLDFLNPPLERRRLSFRAKLGLIGKSFPASAGFGFTCLFLVSIPLLNLLTIPLCVMAGTLFYGDRLYENYGNQH